MNQNRNHESLQQRHAEKNRERVEEMLRDIAFVLQMTRCVRAEIEADQEAEEFALA